MGWVLNSLGVPAGELPTGANPIHLRNGVNKVGRSRQNSCHVTLNSVLVSRLHCEITLLDDLLFIRDLGSFNGTFVNGTRLFGERRSELRHGDILSLGLPYLEGRQEDTAGLFAFRVQHSKEDDQGQSLSRRAALCTSEPVVDLTLDEDPPLASGQLSPCGQQSASGQLSAPPPLVQACSKSSSENLGASMAADRRKHRLAGDSFTFDESEASNLRHNNFKVPEPFPSGAKKNSTANVDSSCRSTAKELAPQSDENISSSQDVYDLMTDSPYNTVNAEPNNEEATSSSRELPSSTSPSSTTDLPLTRRNFESDCYILDSNCQSTTGSESLRGSKSTINPKRLFSVRKKLNVINLEEEYESPLRTPRDRLEPSYKDHSTTPVKSSSPNSEKSKKSVGYVFAINVSNGGTLVPETSLSSKTYPLRRRLTDTSESVIIDLVQEENDAPVKNSFSDKGRTSGSEIIDLVMEEKDATTKKSRERLTSSQEAPKGVIDKSKKCEGNESSTGLSVSDGNPSSKSATHSSLKTRRRLSENDFVGEKATSTPRRPTSGLGIIDLVEESDATTKKSSDRLTGSIDAPKGVIETSQKFEGKESNGSPSSETPSHVDFECRTHSKVPTRNASESKVFIDMGNREDKAPPKKSLVALAGLIEAPKRGFDSLKESGIVQVNDELLAPQASSDFDPNLPSKIPRLTVDLRSRKHLSENFEDFETPKEFEGKESNTDLSVSNRSPSFDTPSHLGLRPRRRRTDVDEVSECRKPSKVPTRRASESNIDTRKVEAPTEKHSDELASPAEVPKSDLDSLKEGGRVAANEPQALLDLDLNLPSQIPRPNVKPRRRLAGDARHLFSHKSMEKQTRLASDRFVIDSVSQNDEAAESCAEAELPRVNIVETISRKSFLESSKKCQDSNVGSSEKDPSSKPHEEMFFKLPAEQDPCADFVLSNISPNESGFLIEPSRSSNAKKCNVGERDDLKERCINKLVVGFVINSSRHVKRPARTTRICRSNDVAVDKLLHDLDSESSRASSPDLSSPGVKPTSSMIAESDSQNSYSVTDIEAHVKALCVEPSASKVETGKFSGDIESAEVEQLENLSFSQEGIIEIDDNDANYSYLFLENCKTDAEGDCLNSDPIDVGPCLIKEEADDIREDAEVDLFESHFAHCSQEIQESVIGEPSQSSPSTSMTKSQSSETMERPSVCGDEESSSNEAGVPTINGGCNRELSKELNKRLQNEFNDNSSVPALTGARLVKSTLLSIPPAEVSKKSRKQKTEPSATRDALAMRTREKNAKERKARLRDLALQKKEKELIENKNKRIIKDDHSGVRESATCPTKLAKITERNRSSKLLEKMLDQQAPKPKPITKKKLPVETLPTKEVTLPMVLHHPTGESKVVLQRLDSQVALKGCRKNPSVTIGNTALQKKVRFSDKNEIKFYECEGKLNKLNKSSSKDRDPLLGQQGVNPVAGQSQVDTFIFSVVKWNPTWIKESKAVKGDPPLVLPVVFRGKDNYVSFSDYFSWLFPMIQYEIWGNIVKSHEEKTAHQSLRKFEGVILHKEVRGRSSDLLTLKCCLPLTSRLVPSFVDPFDNVILTTHNNNKRYIMFGVVDSQIRITRGSPADPIVQRYLSKQNPKFDVCAFFDIVVKNSPNKILEAGFVIEICATYNMMTEFRQFEALCALRTSPLLQTILDPAGNPTLSSPQQVTNKEIDSSFPLNEDQTNAILGASQTALFNQPGISVVHGPPGTGKTRVIVGIIEKILQHYKSQQRKSRPPLILVCTQSNSAIDEICLRLLDVRKNLPKDRRFILSRFGRKERVNPKVAHILTTTLARNEVERAQTEDTFALELKILKAQERMLATTLETSRSEAVRLNYSLKYKTVQDKIKKLEPIVEKTASEELRKKELERLVNDEELKLISCSDIIATTLGSCTSKRIVRALSDPSLQKDNERRKVDVCIIDEASQATEADTLLPLIHGVRSLVLVGDSKQLSPFVISETGREKGLSQSLFCRLYKSLEREGEEEDRSAVFPLRTQHRMHPEIASFPSSSFYGGELLTPSFLGVDRGYRPYALITHPHLQDSPSETNQKEADLIMSFLDEVVENPTFKSISIGIIVPYQKQKSLLLNAVSERHYHRKVFVNTIDSCQGQEWDLVILGTVRTQGVGFLSDPQRTNVAVTRAKRALYIFGNFASLQGAATWREILADAQKREAHFDASTQFRMYNLMNFLKTGKPNTGPSKKRKRSA